MICPSHGFLLVNKVNGRWKRTLQSQIETHAGRLVKPIQADTKWARGVVFALWCCGPPGSSHSWSCVLWV